MIKSIFFLKRIGKMKKNIKTVDYSKTKITGGFWREKQELVRNTTVHAVYNRFKETGRIDAVRCDWREGMDESMKPHHYWDSDVVKWIEGVAYLSKEKREPELEAICDEIIDNFAKNQWEDGYVSSYYTTLFPDKRYTDRNMHELYCMGHLFEAAVAYYEATGKRKLLDVAIKAADHVEDRFKIKRDVPFKTSGHEEIEVALVRLYECTGERRYLDLSKFFIDERGVDEAQVLPQVTNKYFQAHVPTRQQKTAEGHAVRMGYLVAAMADIAREYDDEELLDSCEQIFDNIAKKRMYITGGIGQTHVGEAFTVDYDLPNLLAYNETCAAISLVMFANRMLRIRPDSKFSDVIERVIYNGFISGLSDDGEAFFYTNPTEMMPYLFTKETHRIRGFERWGTPNPQRSKVFNTSCCPPNIVRFIPSIANLLYGDDGETLYVHQFMESETAIERDGRKLTIKQQTDYPRDGKVKITVSGADTKIAVRIPGWYKEYRGETKLGYAYFDVKDGESLEFNFDLTPRFVSSSSAVFYNLGKCAIMRGPLVYCSESCDNGTGLRAIALDLSAGIETSSERSFGMPTLYVKGEKFIPKFDDLYYDGVPEKEEVRVKLIPYYGFANRGEAEMLIWHSFK